MTDLDITDLTDTPTIRRVRHELRRRTLDVTAVERVTPHMIRVTLAGDDLADFASAAPDDHIKVFVPGDGEPAMRDYTPRRYDTDRRELVVDFADHDGGPATGWARDAAVGDTLEIGGPRGSAVIEGVERWLLVGDETALPAIGRRIEELAAGASAVSLVAVAGPADEQAFTTAATHDARWIHRPLAAATDPAPFLTALQTLRLEPRTFVWIAAEAGVARALRQHCLAAGHPRRWIKAAGYWVAGEADASVKDFDAAD